MVNVKRRLAALTAALMPEPLTVICKLPTGEEALLTVDECISAGADPIRVKSGSNIKEAIRLLDYIAGPECVIN